MTKYDEINIDGTLYKREDLPPNAERIVQELERCDMHAQDIAIEQIRHQGAVAGLKQALAQILKNSQQEEEPAAE